MSAIKNFIYDKCIEIAKDLQNLSVINKVPIQANSYIPKKYKIYDPILVDEINDMVLYFITEQGMSIVDALNHVKTIFIQGPYKQFTI